MTSFVLRAFGVFSRRRHIRQRLEEIRRENAGSGASSFNLII
ncbi:hypothetical protein [Sphingobium sp. TomTYG45]